MKKLLLSVSLLLIVMTTNAQLIKGDFGQRASDEPEFIITPLIEHNFSEQSLSMETGLLFGIEAITNHSTLSVGYTYRRYLDVKEANPNYHSLELNSSVYPFTNFGLGFSFQANSRTGKYLDEQLTIGDDIICKCSGKVIGKEDDTRDITSKTKMFGSIGLIYQIDANFRVEAVTMFKDYNPNAWYKQGKDPYSYNPIKVGFSYTIPIFQL